MKLGDYKLIFIVTAIIGSLLIASPAIAGVIRLPEGEQFSELYILGPERMAQDYPFNIIPNQNYSVYINVGNQMGSSEYYLIYVKLLNATDPLPSNSGTPSSEQPLYEYRFSIQNGQTFENLLTFSISNPIISNNQATIGNINTNGYNYSANKSAIWNSTKSMFEFRLIFELWMFNNQSSMIEYNSRYVSLVLNLTTSGSVLAISR